MKKIYFCCVLFFCLSFAKSQTLYFPPLTGNVWDTLSPQSIGWCQARIDSLYNYLEAKNTKSFIILKDGKIILEKYFGTFVEDSLHYWASAGKSLTAFITGIAQQKGLININTKVSQYLGTGWTSVPLAKENLITVKHLLTMTSGLDDYPAPPCDSDDTAKICLQYQVDAGTRWAYHTGAYKKLHDVASTTSGLSINSLTTSWIKNKIGMDGFWLNGVYTSKARGMARFGLLNLNKGVWGNDTLLKDATYFNDMVNTSQTFNLSYGYLWWLNGKPTYMNPGIQLELTGPLISKGPADMFAALGKDDQKIYVVPSQKMVVVRQGASADGVTFALSTFDNALWDYINKLNCVMTPIEELLLSGSISVFPNPSNNQITVRSHEEITSAFLIDVFGKKVLLKIAGTNIDISSLPKGGYMLELHFKNEKYCYKKIVID